MAQLLMPSPPPLSSHYSPYPIGYPPAIYPPAVYPPGAVEANQHLLPVGKVPTQVTTQHQHQHQIVAPPVSNKTTPVQEASKSTTETSNKKRKAKGSEAGKSNRKPQKRFSVSLNNNDKEALFTSNLGGRVPPLTTNNPRKVEALDPTTKAWVRSFVSCSEAARSMGINR